jgi:hypothetical protein
MLWRYIKVSTQKRRLRETSASTECKTQQLFLYIVRKLTPNPNQYKAILNKNKDSEIRIVGGGVQTGSTRHVGHLLAYCTCPE